MKVELRKQYIGGASMFIDFDAIPRKGETICFNRTCESCSDDADFLEEFFGEGEECFPELTVKDVVYHTGGNCPIVILENEIIGYETPSAPKAPRQ